MFDVGSVWLISTVQRVSLWMSVRGGGGGIQCARGLCCPISERDGFSVVVVRVNGLKCDFLEEMHTKPAGRTIEKGTLESMGSMEGE